MSDPSDSPDKSPGETSEPSKPEKKEQQDTAGDGAEANDDQHKAESDKKKADEKPPMSPRKKALVRLVLIVVGLIVLVVGSIFAFQWWTHGRFMQSTNDAYLNADQVSVSARISGYIDEVLVGDNQNVTAGQLLVRIAARDYIAKAEQSRASIAKAQASVQQYRAQLHQQESTIEQAEAQLAQNKAQARQYETSAKYYQGEVARYTPLVAAGAEAQEKLAQLGNSLDGAVARLQAAQAAVVSSAAQVESAHPQNEVLEAQVVSAQADIKQSQAELASAEVDVAAANVLSPITGRVGDRSVRLGQYTQTGTRMMTIVPVQALYVDANYKETQVGLMRIGQPATVEVDALDEKINGVVESFAPGTGAKFAIVPTNNATGNFTKIVQRVPVRIRLDAGPEARKVLVSGLSATVVVDTNGAKTQREHTQAEAKQAKKKRKQEPATMPASAADNSNGPGNE